MAQCPWFATCLALPTCLVPHSCLIPSPTPCAYTCGCKAAGCLVRLPPAGGPLGCGSRCPAQPQALRLCWSLLSPALGLPRGDPCNPASPLVSHARASCRSHPIQSHPIQSNHPGRSQPAIQSASSISLAPFRALLCPLPAATPRASSTPSTRASRPLVGEARTREGARHRRMRVVRTTAAPVSGWLCRRGSAYDLSRRGTCKAGRWAASFWAGGGVP